MDHSNLKLLIRHFNQKLYQMELSARSVTISSKPKAWNRPACAPWKPKEFVIIW